MKKFLALMLLLSLFTVGGTALADDTGRSLIFYFDCNENIDTTGLDVDAISQASMAGTRARDIDRLLVMDIRDAAWFAEHNARSQHGGGGLAAREADIMNWLFSQRKEATNP